MTTPDSIVYPISPEALRARLEAALGCRVTGLQRIDRGYTPAGRYLVDLAGEAQVFAKIGANTSTSAWLRREREVYAALRGDFLPAMLAFDDDGAQPILVLESLGRAHWPPPWAPGQPERVRDAMAEVARQRVHGLQPLQTLHPTLAEGWQRVAEAPEPFLSLGLATRTWLEAALETLLAASTWDAVRGEDVLHCDLRSDNLCFLGERVVIVDWNHACLGDARLDLAAWAPSLHDEGGPAPEAILPDAPNLAAIISGFFAARAGLPIIPEAPRVRDVQRSQLSSALPWAQRALGLPKLDGPAAC